MLARSDLARSFALAPKTPFTFGVPLLPRASAGNWELIECLFRMTLDSILAQSDQYFRVIVAGHDRPHGFPRDHRVEFLQANWPPEPQRRDNLDRGRKVHAINELVMSRGGGLLMFVDADDWVDVRLVATARALIGRDHIGGVLTAGFATDFRTLRTASLPDARIFHGEFHQICGSSTVAHLKPGDRDPIRRDPHRILHEHYRWTELASEFGASLARLPSRNNYLINTSENHSETHGPFTSWRREFTRAVNENGAPMTEETAASFGLKLDRVRESSDQFQAGLSPRER